MKRVAIAFQGGISAVDGQRVLQQVVRAEARESETVEVRRGGQDGRRDLEHHPELDLTGSLSGATDLRTGALGELAESRHVAGICDHRRHDLDPAAGRGAMAGAQLSQEQVPLRLRQSKRPDPQEGVVLGRDRQVRDRLVPAHVEQADRDGMRRERLRDRAVGLGLLVLGRGSRALQEQEFGPEQADPSGAQGHRGLTLRRRPDVGLQRDDGAVARDDRERSFVQISFPVSPPELRALLEGREVLRAGGDDDLARRAIDCQLDKWSALGQGSEQAGRAHDRRDAVRPGEDRGMGGRRRALQGDPKESVPWKRGGHRRREVVRDDDHRLAQGHVGEGHSGHLPGDLVTDVDDVSCSRPEELVVEPSEHLGSGGRRGGDRSDGVDGVLPDVARRRPQELRVECHCSVGLEDLGFVRQTGLSGPRRQLLGRGGHCLRGGHQPGYLGIGLALFNSAGSRQRAPLDPHPMPSGDPRRRRDATEQSSRRGLRGHTDGRSFHDVSIRARSRWSWTVTASRSLFVSARIRVPGDRTAATDHSTAWRSAPGPPPAAR